MDTHADQALKVPAGAGRRRDRSLGQPWAVGVIMRRSNLSGQMVGDAALASIQVRGVSIRFGCHLYAFG